MSTVDRFTQESLPALPRTLSPLRLFALSFGTIIGVGWITVLGVWLSQGGALGAVVGFLLGGLLILIIAVVYTEAALMFPVSGGEVAYAYRMFNTFAGFFVGWFLVLSYIATTSFEAVSVAWLVDAIRPSGAGPILYSIGGEDVRLRGLVLGLLGMSVVAGVNYFGAKVASTFQLAMVGALAVSAIVFAGAAISRGDLENLTPLFGAAHAGSANLLPPSLVGILTVMAATPFWFAGFDTVPQAMGEVKQGIRPGRLAAVLIASIAASIIFYGVIILSSALSAPREALLASDLPAAFAMEQAFQSALGRNFVLIIGLCGLISTWNAIFFAATRVLYTLGKARFVPPIFAKLSKRYQSPSISIWFLALIGAIGALLGKTAITVVVDVSAVILSGIFLAIVIGVIRLRKSEPQLERPFLAPFGMRGLYTALASAAAILFIALAQFLNTVLSGDVLRPAVLIGWACVGLIFWKASASVRQQLTKEERDAFILSSQ